MKHRNILFQIFDLNDQAIVYEIVYTDGLLTMSGNILFLRDLDG
ncbi:MAG: hypothetical protein PHS48_07815 [Bacteroidales bacterium]|nr:hypothetical protein [Bacteroidales bacterium]